MQRLSVVRVRVVWCWGQKNEWVGVWANPFLVPTAYFGREPVGNGHAPVGLSADLRPGVAAVEGIAVAMDATES